MAVPPKVIGSRPQPTTGATRAVPKTGSTTTSLGAPAEAGRARIAAVGSTSFVEFWVDGPILPSESGGWQVVDREGAEGTLEYAGEDPPRWTVPVMLDGFVAGVDLTDQWNALLALLEPEGDRPPEVRLAGAVPRAVASRAFVIEKQVPGSERLTNAGNDLLRAQTVVTIIRASFGKDIASPIKQAVKAAKGHSSRTIRARSGDTLVSIAARELGDPEKWRELSKLNGGLQPDNVKAGQKVKLP
jgi:nucleoid-associated protein YgaU